MGGSNDIIQSILISPLCPRITRPRSQTPVTGSLYILPVVEVPESDAGGGSGTTRLVKDAGKRDRKRVPESELRGRRKTRLVEGADKRDHRRLPESETGGCCRRDWQRVPENEIRVPLKQAGEGAGKRGRRVPESELRGRPKNEARGCRKATGGFRKAYIEEDAGKTRLEEAAGKRGSGFAMATELAHCTSSVAMVHVSGKTLGPWNYPRSALHALSAVWSRWKPIYSRWTAYPG